MLAKLTTLKGVMLLFVLVLSLPALAQKKIDGKVTGPDGKPVFGATVSVKGTNVATSTNSEGVYSITLPANSNVLVISYVGYEVYEVEAKANNVVDVSMKPQTTSLNEVVVTGYSSQRKKDITGAVTVVNVTDLKSIPAANPTAQLQGRASGVTVVQNGVPGADAKVRIRGMGSFNNNSPLYVVDGVQTSSIAGISPTDVESMQVLKDAASSAIYGVRGSNGVIVITTKKGKKRGVTVSYDMYYGVQDPGKGLEMLNAQEEANLLFLARKNSGMSTASAYGTGATPVLPDYIYYTGSPNSASSATPINTGNAGVDPTKYQLDYGRLGDAGYSPYIIVPANKAGTNWYDEVTRTAPIQNHNLSISGAGEGSKFLVSLNYFNQQAITEYQFYKRITARVNSEFTILKNVRIGENIQILGSESNVPGNTSNGSDRDNNKEASIIAQTFRPMSIIPVFTIKPGDYAGNIGANGFGTWGNSKNPAAQLYRTKNDRNNNVSLFGNVYAEVDFAHHFTARTSFGGSVNTNNAYTYPWIEYEHNENTANNTYTENFIRNNNWIWTNTLAYKNSFGKHDLSVLAGQESSKGGGRQMIGAATNFYSYNYQPYINLNNGAVQNLSGSSIFAPVATLSYFGKIDYAYQGKYLLSALIRRDGSSKFLGDNRWGNFPAFSAGWRLSEESFMKGISFINDLKIRGSWGKSGNEAALSASNAYTTFGSNPTSSSYDINGAQTTPEGGFFLNFNGNPNGTWEENITTNIGFDATILNNSTDIVFDWYQKKTEGLLYNPAGQGIMGAVAANTPSFRNVGSMENHGIDLMITNRANITKELRLVSTLTFTTYSNKITEINGTQKFFDYNSPANEANRIGANVTRNFVGQPYNTFYGYDVIGLFQSAADVASSPTQSGSGPGRFKFRDVNGDKVINDDDRTILGDPNPDFSYGINLGLDYKGFDLSAFFYGVSGKDAFNLTRWWTDFTPGGFPGGRGKRALYESWLPDGSRPNATTPIQEVGAGTGFSSQLSVNSYYVENASFFRMRNLQIGYTLPMSLISKARMSKARVYIQATNLFTSTKYTGMDPDFIVNDDRAAAIDVGAYPNVKQFLIGASINF